MAGTVIIDTLRRGQLGTGTFPVAEEQDLRLSYISVADIATRDTIPEWKRSSKMTAYVIADNKEYRLGTDLTIAGQVWTEKVTTDPNALTSGDILDGDGYIKSTLIKNLFINDSFVVTDEAAMLALTTVIGNVVLQTSGANAGTVWIKLNNDDPSDISDFANITANTGAVLTVNGETGNVDINIASLLAVGQNVTDFNAQVGIAPAVTQNASAISSIQTAISGINAAIALLQGTSARGILIYDIAESYLTGDFIRDINGTGDYELFEAIDDVPIGESPYGSNTADYYKRVGDYYTKSEITSLLSLKADLVSGKIPIGQIPTSLLGVQIVADIAARNALSPYEGLRVIVLDASGDPNITSGAAEYVLDSDYPTADANGFVFIPGSNGVDFSFSGAGKVRFGGVGGVATEFDTTAYGRALLNTADADAVKAILQYLEADDIVNDFSSDPDDPTLPAGANAVYAIYQILASNDVDYDTIQEIVDFIKSIDTNGELVAAINTAYGINLLSELDDRYTKAEVLNTFTLTEELTFDALSKKSDIEQGGSFLFTLAASGNIDSGEILARVNEPTSITFDSIFEKIQGSEPVNTAKLIHIYMRYDADVNVVYYLIKNQASQDLLRPVFVSYDLEGRNRFVDITFSKGVYTDDSVSALLAADLLIDYTGGVGTDVSISSITKPDSISEGLASALTGGETIIRVFLDSTGEIEGTETINITPVDGASISDDSGNFMLAGATTGDILLNDQTDDVVNLLVGFDASDSSKVVADAALTLADQDDQVYGIYELSDPNFRAYQTNTGRQPRYDLANGKIEGFQGFGLVLGSPSVTTPQAMSGDFHVFIKAAPREVSPILLGQVATDNFIQVKTATNTVDVKIAGTVNTGVGTNGGIVQNTLGVYEVKRSGTTVTVLFEGNVLDSFTEAGTLTFDNIARSGSNYTRIDFTGIRLYNADKTATAALIRSKL